ncbi:FliG C-terminal domain-containing protein [Treponema sp.]|uniref:FliG C-terminal domain-containing protein n=1 Tax=Treponema sp. TaxID=166 RepID=UPI00388E3134
MGESEKPLTEQEIALKNFDVAVKHLEDKMAEHLTTFLTSGYQRTMAYVYSYLKKMSPQKAEEVEKLMDKGICEKILSLAQDVDVHNGEVLSEVAHVFDTLDFNNRQILTEAHNASTELWSQKELFNAEMDKLLDTNPLLSTVLDEAYFVFSDIAKLSKQDIQRILQRIDKNVLQTALIDADKDVKSAIFSAISQRAANMMKDDIEYMKRKLNGQTQEISESRLKICQAVQCLIDENEIVMPR